MRRLPHFQRWLDRLPGAVYTCDAEGLITYYNHQAVQLWGRTPKLNDPEDRFCGSFKLHALDGSPIPHDRCWMALTLQALADHHGCEIVVERPDGQRLTCLAFASPLCDESGELLGAINMLVDISERKRAEVALNEARVEAQAARAAAERASRVKDEFLAAMSHELRTPLTPALLLAQVLERDPGLAPEHREMVAEIAQHISLQAQFIAGLLSPPGSPGDGTVLPAPAGPADGLASSRPLRILVVEDHASTARALRRLLLKHDHEVHLTSSLASAELAVRNQPFDLLICDLQLPDGSGHELLPRLRRGKNREAGNVPAIVLSGFAQREDVARSLAAGYAAHLAKPVEESQLLAALQLATEQTWR